ncbi:MAG: helix-turn-helix transcriptional regulator [Ruminococcaceae bacterium]|nr:helix-turn-helix transcriptional regulator [Oscillospiraceae bacterium]
MTYTPLTELIHALEAGTKLHISVAFFSPVYNRLIRLPSSQIIHSSAYCTETKRISEQLSECYRIREKKFKRAKEEKKPFVSLCPYGITEYLHPVLFRNSVICLIMISGNTPAAGVAPDFTQNALSKAKVMENHILLLMESAPVSPDEPDAFSAQATRILRDGMADKISVKELAASMGYHEKYFGAKFKEKTGKSPTAYRNEQRLSKAEALLRNTHLSVIEIATRTGFDNVSYFNRLFRQKNGVTPTEYRKRNRT